MQVQKHARSIAGRSTTMMLMAVPLFFQAGRELADTNVICLDCGDYCGLNSNSEPASRLDLDALCNQALLWAQVGEEVEIPEESLSVTRALNEEIGCAFPVRKKGYVGLI